MVCSCFTGNNSFCCGELLKFAGTTHGKQRMRGERRVPAPGLFSLPARRILGKMKEGRGRKRVGNGATSKPEKNFFKQGFSEDHIKHGGESNGAREGGRIGLVRERARSQNSCACIAT